MEFLPLMGVMTSDYTYDIAVDKPLARNITV